MSQPVTATLVRLARCLVGLVVAAGVLQAAPAVAVGMSSISGAGYDDANRDGVHQAGEAPFSGQVLLLFDAAGTNVASVQTDANGGYVFTGLADGGYTVKFSSQNWFSLRNDWVPTTTGSLFYNRTVSLAGSAVADFGLRRIVRASSIDSPISTYTASSGLVVRSYDDAVRADEIVTALARGSLSGAEAATTKVYFDFGTQTDATTSASGQNGSYTNHQA